MARPRKPGNQDLPQYLEGPNRDGLYRYRCPDGRFPSLGRHRETAIATAKELNAAYDGVRGLVAKASNEKGTINQFLDEFWLTIVAEREWKSVTLTDYEQKLVHLRDRLGKRGIGSIQILQVANFLDAYPNTQSNRYRALLGTIFKYAIAKDWRKQYEGNPAYLTISKPEHVKRHRLNLEGYRTIWPLAKPHIQNGMDLSLYSLQRREDISKMRRSDYKGQLLEVIQSKTSAAIKIYVGDSLDRIIARCRDDVLTEWMIHHPLSNRSRELARRVRPETLSRGFKKARDASGFYEDLEPEERPTFHEIRALGAELYRQAEVSETTIQVLLGHGDIKMTQLYLSRHEKQFREVFAGLEL